MPWNRCRSYNGSVGSHERAKKFRSRENTREQLPKELSVDSEPKEQLDSLPNELALTRTRRYARSALVENHHKCPAPGVPLAVGRPFTFVGK